MTPETFPVKTWVEERDRTRGTFVLGRWARQLSNGSDFSVQAFSDRNQMTRAASIGTNGSKPPMSSSSTT
jgi:hypothetical protein